MAGAPDHANNGWHLVISGSRARWLGTLLSFVAQRAFRFGFFGSARPMGGIGTNKTAGRGHGKQARNRTPRYGAQKTKPEGPSRNEPPESRGTAREARRSPALECISKTRQALKADAPLGQSSGFAFGEGALVGNPAWCGALGGFPAWCGGFWRKSLLVRCARRFSGFVRCSPPHQARFSPRPASRIGFLAEPAGIALGVARPAVCTLDAMPAAARSPASSPAVGTLRPSNDHRMG